MSLVPIADQLTGLLGPSREPNCGVTAVAIVSGRPFAEVFATIKAQQGRGANWKGRTYLKDRLQALDTFGVPHLPVYRVRYRGESRNTLATWARRLPRDVTYLVDVTGHTVTLRGGKIIDQCLRDWTPLERTRSARKMVNGITRIAA